MGPQTGTQIFSSQINGFMFLFHVIGEVVVQLDFFWQGDETGLKQQRTDNFLCLTLQGVADPSKQLAGSIGMSQCPI